MARTTVRRLRRVRCAAVALVAVVLLPAACGEEQAPPSVVVIGVGSTTEQQVLAALTAVVLEEAGIASELRPELGDTVSVRRHALRGTVDLFWDYTGAAWALGLGQHNPPAEPVESYQRVREADLSRGLVWLTPTKVNATLALFVRGADLPTDSDATGMDWLAAVLSGGEATLCVDDDFRRRPGGLRELALAYPMDLARLRVRSADEAEAIEGVASGRCFAGLATATSGDARLAGLVPVEDELGVFPAFVVAPVVREDTFEQIPALADALAAVSARLDTAALARLNAEAQAGAEPEALARAFLAEAPPTP